MNEALPAPATQVDPLRIDRDAAPTHRRIVHHLTWWVLTIVTLVVLDDLTFGPFFWLVARLAGAPTAVVLIFAIYVPAQVYLVRRGTAEHPGRIAAFFLDRLDLSRRHPRIREREHVLRAQVGGGVSAILSSLLIAGVLPPLLLWRNGYSTTFVRRISWATATVYATEFAVLHGFLPTLI